MERLDAEVRRELGRFGPIEGDTAAIVRAWPHAVGETVARNAWPARIARDGTLLVHTASSTWAFELGRLAETILSQLRDELGAGTPRALKFAARTAAGGRAPRHPPAARKRRSRAVPSAAPKPPRSPPRSRTTSCAGWSPGQPRRASREPTDDPLTTGVSDTLFSARK